MITIEIFERGSTPRYRPPTQSSPSGSIRHDHDRYPARLQRPRADRLLLIRNGDARTNAPCRHQPPANATTATLTQPSIRAMLPACHVIARHHRASRSFARTFRVSQIPIAERAALSAHHRPRVRSLAAFGRRPPCSRAPSMAGIRNPQQTEEVGSPACQVGFAPRLADKWACQTPRDN